MAPPACWVVDATCWLQALGAERVKRMSLELLGTEGSYAAAEISARPCPSNASEAPAPTTP